jgi:hypothetical protein
VYPLAHLTFGIASERIVPRHTARRAPQEGASHVGEMTVESRGAPPVPLHGHINFDERREVHRWCAALGVTYEQLRYVVEAVGTSAAKVLEYLAPPARGR